MAGASPIMPITAVSTAPSRGCVTVEIIKGILDDGVKEGIFSMPDTDITALVLHHALKGLEVPYIRGIMGDNISQRIKRRDNVMNLIFNGIKIK